MMKMMIKILSEEEVEEESAISEHTEETATKQQKRT